MTVAMLPFDDTARRMIANLVLDNGSAYTPGYRTMLGILYDYLIAQGWSEELLRMLRESQGAFSNMHPLQCLGLVMCDGRSHGSPSLSAFNGYCMECSGLGMVYQRPLVSNDEYNDWKQNYQASLLEAKERAEYERLKKKYG